MDLILCMFFPAKVLGSPQPVFPAFNAVFCAHASSKFLGRRNQRTIRFR